MNQYKIVVIYKAFFGLFEREYCFSTLVEQDIFVETLLDKKYISKRDPDLFFGSPSLVDKKYFKISLIEKIFWIWNKDALKVMGVKKEKVFV